MAEPRVDRFQIWGKDGKGRAPWSGGKSFIAVLGLAIVQWQGIRRLAREGLSRDRHRAR